ncbi:MAG: GNAT family N-acetyltransferase [Pseudomonadota bacterium]
MRIATNLNGVTLREANEGDVDTIFDFIIGLADYEKLRHEVTATPEDIRAALFGEQAIARVVLGEVDLAPVGFALFFYNFSTFVGRCGIYLEDLFVNPDGRGRGVGRALLSYLGHLAVNEGCGRVEWTVLDWNTPSIEFYHALGARPLNDWTIERVSGAGLQTLASNVTFERYEQ